MMVYLVAACLSIAFVGGGHAFPNLFALGDECTKYRSVSLGVSSCQETSYPEIDFDSDVITIQTVLHLINFTCSNLPVWRQCIENRFMNCGSKEQILTQWEKSYAICQGTAPASWIVNYASMNFGSVSKYCIAGVYRTITPCLRDVMNNDTFPEEDPGLQDGTDMIRAVVAAVFNCAKSNIAKAISDTSECSGSSKKDVIFTINMIGTALLGDSFASRLTQEQLNVVQGMLAS